MNGKHLDRIGESIIVGDRVAFIEVGYRSLALGKVSALTAQKVRIRYGKRDEETLRFPNEVINVSRRALGHP